ncbi:hypothetical protein [Streptomyces hiroshimensis]|uniref:Integral membrane protein n=1 Tax=Streptomyces hiroshimensis TaxID=66424 RepID=A0ABQ2YCF7_9ACTN|nr:hypothetical protein [Streptomyces hiroshimensis]GGX79022.1 hypothetical protein GCM10010324_25730 [Streptomyces hiroshimensis]
MATRRKPLAEGRAEGPVEGLNHPGIQRALRNTKRLIACFVGLSVGTLAAVVLLRNHHDIVTDAVWVRTSIVVAASLLMASWAAKTARGHGRSYTRLRFSSVGMTVAIAVIVALPGAFPTWLKVEQAACGVLLLGVLLAVNGKQMRSVFAKPGIQRQRPRPETGPLPGDGR